MKPFLGQRSFLLASSLLASAFTAHAQNTWDNGGGTSSWGLNANWSGDTLPGFSGDTTDIVFDGTASGESFLAAARAIRSLTLTPAAATAVTVRTTTTPAGTVAASLTLVSATQGGSITYESGTGIHIVGSAGGNIVLANNLTVTNHSSSTQLFSRGITGTGFGMTKEGAGTIQFNAANSFTGNTQINAGTILSSGPANFSNSTIILNGSTARLRISTTANLTMARNFEITPNGGIISKGSAGTLNYTGTYTSAGIGNRTLELQNDNITIGVATMTGVLSDPSSGAFSINKTFNGVWVLAGANTFSGSNSYTGATNISGGTPALGANDVIPDTTNVAIGNATLDAVIPAVGIYTAAVTFIPTDPANYHTVAGTVDISIQTAFDAWANESTTLTGDTNSDGLTDGLAWLLGATDPYQNVSTLAPRAAVSDENMVVSFNYLIAAKRGTASLRLQYSNDLGTTAPWDNHTVIVPDTNGTIDGVTFVITPNGDTNQVQATVPSSAAGSGGKIFVRLNAEP